MIIRRVAIFQHQNVKISVNSVLKPLLTTFHAPEMLIKEEIISKFEHLFQQISTLASCQQKAVHRVINSYLITIQKTHSQIIASS